ncbi:MAG TPA: DUF1579 family protein [Candidatus Eisenbacteria bacterium]
MKTIPSILLAAALSIALPATLFAVDKAPPKKDAKSATPPKSTEAVETEAPAKMSGPPPAMGTLQGFVGSWTGTMHVYAGPMGPESTGPSKVTFRSTLGGMHLEGDHQFEAGGSPAAGRSLWGWDPDRKQYQCVWIDGSTSAIYLYTGTANGDSAVVLTRTTMVKTKAVTEVLTFRLDSKDQYTLALTSDASGAMKPILEEKGTREGAGSKPGQ